MLVIPKELLVSGPLWVTERANMYFVLQRRKGRGRGFSALLVGTIDSVRENKPAPYRILHQAEGSEVYYLVSESATSQEALEDWQYFEKEMLPTLADFENPEEATEFVQVKIKSILAAAEQGALNSNTPAIPSSALSAVPVAGGTSEDSESIPFKAAADRFHRHFSSCAKDKLVSYYSCSW